MLSLFEESTPSIDGLIYIPDFISREEEANLLSNIDQQSWPNDLKRRVQHYGYKYDYRARNIDKSFSLGPLPSWLDIWADRLKTQGYFSSKPDQAIINEYEPGHGISAHIDCEPCFGDIIASLSLGSGAMMQFKKSRYKRRNLSRAKKFSYLI